MFFIRAARLCGLAGSLYILPARLYRLAGRTEIMAHILQKDNHCVV